MLGFSRRFKYREKCDTKVMEKDLYLDIFWKKNWIIRIL